MTPRNPIQPIIRDSFGRQAFKPNAIVRFLLDSGGYDMNDLHKLDFSQDDREQFAQLIGYSLSGFSELSYVSDITYNTAVTMEEFPDERDARINALQSQLDRITTKLREIYHDLNWDM